MKICFLARPNATSGGDYVALQGYSKALWMKGVSVTTRPATDPGNLSEFDFVHLWAACSPDWGLPAAQEVKRQNKRLIITPFWWSRAERQKFYGREGQDLIPGYTPAVGETLRLADALFCVTPSEAKQCWELAPHAPAYIVPMGTEVPERLKAQEPQDYVFCIGRIEPHKNQHSLAEACKRLGYNLLLFGQCSNAGYMVTVGENCDVEKFNWSDKEDDIYKWGLLSRARVHALPSFFENPGLVHGEALALGIPAVMGNRGCEPEFYGDHGIYCDPTSVDSIAAALEIAWNKKRIEPVKLPTWADAARVGLSHMEPKWTSPL